MSGTMKCMHKLFIVLNVRDGTESKYPSIVFLSICSCFQHSGCRINSTAALRGTFILELMDGPFYNFRERKSRESSQISINSSPIRAAFGVFITNS